MLQLFWVQKELGLHEGNIVIHATFRRKICYATAWADSAGEKVSIGHILRHVTCPSLPSLLHATVQHRCGQFFYDFMILLMLLSPSPLPLHNHSPVRAGLWGTATKGESVVARSESCLRGNSNHHHQNHPRSAQSSISAFPQTQKKRSRP